MITKLKNYSGLIAHDPVKNLIDEKLIGQTIIEYLRNNDPEGFIAILNIYI